MMPDVNNNDLSTGEVVYFPGGRASCCFTTAATKIIIRVWGGVGWWYIISINEICICNIKAYQIHVFIESDQITNANSP